MAMHRGTPTHSLWSGLRQILTHGVITALAVAIAFSLPGIASYILNEWWPEVESNANLLLATEIALASVLALLFNLAKIAWDSKQGVLTARLASLMYARNAGAGLVVAAAGTCPRKAASGRARRLRPDPHRIRHVRRRRQLAAGRNREGVRDPRDAGQPGWKSAAGTGGFLASGDHRAHLAHRDRGDDRVSLGAAQVR